MKAIILARVSTEEQKEAGNSLPAQIERMEKYCNRIGLKVIKKYSFDESAYKIKRDEFDKILEDIENSKEKLAICFDKVDRLSRNVFDKRVALLYEKALTDEIELHFVSDGQIINSQMSAVEKFQFGMSLGLAKYYSDAISDNVKRAFEQKRRKGEWTGHAPFGYLNVVNEDGSKKDIIPDPERASVVVELFTKYATGNYSFDGLSDDLEKRCIKTSNNQKVYKSVVHQILKNPFYYGDAYSKKFGIYKHKYKPLISKDLWLTVKEVREQKNNNPVKTKSGKDFIFGGLLKCANCGCSMTAELKKGKYVYYSCTNAKGVCKRVYTNENEFIKPVNNVLSSLKLSDEQVQQIVEFLKENHIYQAKYHKDQIKRLRRQYDALQGKADSLLDLLIDKKIPQEVYDQKSNELRNRQRNIEIELEEYTSADESYHITAKTILSLAQRAREIFDSSETPEKRQLLKYLLQNPTVKDGKLVFKLQTPFDTIASVSGCPIELHR